MQTEDLIDVLPGSSNAGCEGDNAELHDSNSESCSADSQQQNLEVNENKLDMEVSGMADADVAQVGGGVLQAAELDGGLMESSSVMEVTVEVKEVLSVVEDANCLNYGIQSENGCIKETSPIGRQKREGSPVSDSLSSAKKARIMVDEPQQPSVKVMFNFLTRDSKQKLEELLQQWSEWHAKQRSLSHDPSEVLDSGERTYFPALHIGQSDSSAVSVWMDNYIGSQHGKEMTPIDSKSVPLYDRGYSWALTSTDVSSNLEGGLEIIDSSRCFNCGAYDHALKECPKPRDNAAVNNARKEHNSKRNLNANSRNPTRYYQDSSGGKYDGLRPGVLDAETRKLLGLGEFDPPPWLNRMREIGYPPGYLDPDDEDLPSGILIFGDEEHKEETEDGEILDTDFPEPPGIINTDPPRKMSVQFPGINAPIPENASKSQWSAVPSSSDFYTNRSQRANYFSERSMYHDQRWSRDIKNESHSTSRYDDLDSSYSFQREGGIIYATLVNRSSERSFSDRGRWSPSTHDDSANHGSYNFRQSSPPNRLFSSQSYGSGSSRRWDDDRRNDSSSSRHRDRDRDDGYHPYRWR